MLHSIKTAGESKAQVKATMETARFVSPGSDVASSVGLTYFRQPKITTFTVASFSENVKVIIISLFYMRCIRVKLYTLS